MPTYWGETKFQPREFPRSGSKAKGGKERKILQGLRVAQAAVTE